MMKSMKSMLMGGVILLGLAMCLTSCEGTLDDIFGEWSRPTHGTSDGTKPDSQGNVTSISIAPTTLELAAGETGQLTATVDPSGTAVTWSSDKEEVATVDANGLVTAVAAGTATITATATNGTDDTADDKTATCEVTISAKKVNVESVTLDKPTLTATAGDAAVTLKATVTPDDATDKTVTWESSNTSVATVADGVVTFVGVGTATITATATNGTADTSDDKTATCAVTLALPPIPYKTYTWDGTTLSGPINANATEYTKVTSSTITWSDGTYVVDDNVTISEKIKVSGNVNLILCDGKTLTVNGGISYSSYGDGILSIYTQSVGTSAGSFVATCNNGNAIFALNTLKIYGGDILASSSSIGWGGIVNTQIDVYGGKLTTKNTSSNGYGIYIGGNISINLFGGELIAEGQGTGSDAYGIVLNNTSSCLTVYPGAKLYASNPTGDASHYAIKGKIKSGTSAVLFTTSNDGTTWGVGTPYNSATTAPTKKYVKVGY